VHVQRREKKRGKSSGERELRMRKYHKREGTQKRIRKRPGAGHCIRGRSCRLTDGKGGNKVPSSRKEGGPRLEGGSEQRTAGERVERESPS